MIDEKKYYFCNLTIIIRLIINLLKMKKFFVIAVALLMSVAIRAQRLDVEETTAVIGGASYPAMVTKVMFADSKTVIKEFTNLIKTYNPKSLVIKKNVITADSLIISTVSQEPINMFASITQTKGSDIVDVAVAFSLGPNVYITSSQAPSMYPSASNLLKNFANGLTAKNREAILSKLGKELDKEEKKLASYEKKSASYQKSIDSYQKNLDKAQQKNREATTNIEDTKAKMETSENLIKEYSNGINATNSDDAVKKALKLREKEQKKYESYQKSFAGYQKNLESSVKDIEKNTKGKTKVEGNLEVINKSIEKQRGIVREKKDAYRKIENQ